MLENISPPDKFVALYSPLHIEFHDFNTRGWTVKLSNMLSENIKVNNCKFWTFQKGLTLT